MYPVSHETRYPAITVYGTNGGDRNLIQQNLIWRTLDHGIQTAAYTVIRHNFVADSGGCEIYSREQQAKIQRSKFSAGRVHKTGRVGLNRTDQTRMPIPT